MLVSELNHNSEVQLMNSSSALSQPFSEMCSSASLTVPDTPKDGVVIKVGRHFQLGIEMGSLKND